MKEKQKIAIIGAALKYPYADNFKDLDRIYETRFDCIHDISEKRRKLNGLDPNEEYTQFGYLEELDEFDYKFFNLSKSEAICMDPQSRITLELACGAIESAGYSLSSLRGTNTAVIIGTGKSSYDQLFKDETGFAATGTMADAIAGRISYSLDLHGEATVVSTACSSSMYATYDACVKLAAGMCDAAIVGGVLLYFNVLKADAGKRDVSTIGLAASDGRCHTFDDCADGINMCEGAGVVFLKRYEDAVRDHDNILSVISGFGSNHDGQRSNSFTAPSVTAQAELFEKVWRNFSINPENIGYYEAHGTGTKIGDPIEIASITEAYRKFTDKKQICPVGSLKTNFAHAGAAAGVASILKGILSINEKKKYPLRTLNKKNHMIDFENAPVYPIAEQEEWLDEHRVFAINGFGSSGTNVHIVMENAPLQPKYEDLSDEFLITISAKEKERVDIYKEKILESIKGEYELGDICWNLNAARDDYEYRTSTVVKSKEELFTFLSKPSIIRKKQEFKKILLCSGTKIYVDEEISALCKHYPIIKNVYEIYKKECNSQEEKSIAIEAAILTQWNDWGITADMLIGTERGSIAIDLYNGKIGAAQIADEIAKRANEQFQKVGFCNYIRSMLEAEEKSILCLDISGNQGKMFLELKEQFADEQLIVLAANDRKSLLFTLADLYCCGINVDWKEFYKDTKHNKLFLATYPFAKTSAWPSKIIPQYDCEISTVEKEEEEEEDLKKFLLRTWQELLETEELTVEDDLFDFGANSLVSMAVSKVIQEKTGVELEFDDLYDYYTVESLAEFLTTKIASEEEKKQEAKKIVKVPRKQEMQVSSTQRRMLFIWENTQNKAIYNMPILYKISNQLDEEIFIECLRRIVRRHEILHTIYGKNKADYYQTILENYDLEIKLIDMQGKKNEEIKTFLKKESERSFNLFKEIPVRSVLVRENTENWYWLLNTHHIAADGWSMGIFCNELNKEYNALIKGEGASIPELPVQYADFAEYENEYRNSDIAKKEKEYWIENLNGVNGILHFPVDKEIPKNRKHIGVEERFECSIEFSEQLRQFARKHNLSMFMLLQGAYAILLYRYSGEKDFCIGVPFANREEEELQNVIGFFANTLVLRCQCEEEESIGSFLEINKKNVLNAFANARCSFEDVISNIKFERDSQNEPLVQYAFAFQNYLRTEMQLKDVFIEEQESMVNASKFNMVVTMYEDHEQLKGMVEYDQELFSKKLILQIIKDYKCILDCIVKEEEEKISYIKMSVQKELQTSENPEDSLFE